MTQFRVDRSLLLERDPENLKDGMALSSIREADWRHQAAAATAGYNSVAEMAIDELIGLVRELNDRIDALEGAMIQHGWSLPDVHHQLDG